MLDASGSYRGGEHTAHVSYRITGAARRPGEVVELYFRPLTDVEIGTVTVKGPGLQGARCVTIPPESVPCGTVSGGTLRIPAEETPPADQAGTGWAGRWGLGDNHYAELVVEADPASYTLAEPTIDQG